MTTSLSEETKKQITQCVDLVKKILNKNLLGVYLYGSALLGGLQKYSDIDLLVISGRATTQQEKSELITNLLKISGIYMKSAKLPVEMTIVVNSAINPWSYPPQFDFQYGDWLRQEFESGQIEPWPTKQMPQLAIMLTQLLLASKTLVGPEPYQLINKIPYEDIIHATIDSLDSIMADLQWDTRNVLLTLARIWSTLQTDSIRSKSAAATWAIERLPEVYRDVLKRAKSICLGEEPEHWEDLKTFIQPCAEYMKEQIEKQVSTFNFESVNIKKSIKLAK